MTRIIVCDTGPLLHLSEAGAIHLLSSAGEVLMPLCWLLIHLPGFVR